MAGCHCHNSLILARPYRLPSYQSHRRENYMSEAVDIEATNFQKLVSFTYNHGPTIISNHGGRISKIDFYQKIKNDFTQIFGWSSELDVTNRGNVMVAHNAIAWGLANLCKAHLILPTSGKHFVTLRQDITWEKQVESAAYNSAKSAIYRAKKLNISYDLDFPERSIAQIRKQQFRCILSGLKFDILCRTPGAGGTIFAPSPDRIDPDLGYKNDNVQWIIWALNRGKGTMPLGQFIQICTAVAAHTKSTSSLPQ